MTENTNNNQETAKVDNENQNCNKKAGQHETDKEKITQENPNTESKTDKKTRKTHLRHNNDKALEEEKAKTAELNDKYLRLASDFDNYRKRTAKEKLDMQAVAAQKVIKELLPVLDDFERALKNNSNSGNESDLQGMTLIYRKLRNTLISCGLEEIEAMGADFNTDEHEALTQIPAPDETQKGKVLDVIQKGYRLNGEVIRYARVVVGN